MWFFFEDLKQSESKQTKLIIKFCPVANNDANNIFTNVHEF